MTSNIAIKPIETEYKGCMFRSRLEARWAVFFDNIGVGWQYEPEGFDFDGTWYLPDFWLSKWNCFVEIKPRRDNTWHSKHDEHKLCTCNAGKLARAFPERDVLVFYGDPWQDEGTVNTNFDLYLVSARFLDYSLAQGLVKIEQQNGKPVFTHNDLPEGEGIPFHYPWIIAAAIDPDEQEQSDWLLVNKLLTIWHPDKGLIYQICSNSEHWGQYNFAFPHEAYKRARSARFGKNGRG